MVLQNNILMKYKTFQAYYAMHKHALLRDEFGLLMQQNVLHI